MIQIDDVIISLDIMRENFLCDLNACKGECCIEGDAGAPLEEEEIAEIEEALPYVEDDLSPEAREVIKKQGVGRYLLLCLGEGLPCRSHQVLQTRIMPPLSHTCHPLEQRFHRLELPSLECM
jgi:hypothetical protein